MIFKRDINLIAYPVNTAYPINYEAGLRVQEPNIRQPVIVPGAETGFGSLASLASYLIPLPKDYAEPQILFFLLRTTGDLELTVSSAEAGISINYIFGTAACPALFVRQSMVTNIVVTNPTAALTEVPFSWVAVSLPDLSLNSSYQGMSSDGTVYLS